MLLALQDFALFESAENDEMTNTAKRSSDNVCIASGNYRYFCYIPDVQFVVGCRYTNLAQFL